MKVLLFTIGLLTTIQFSFAEDSIHTKCKSFAEEFDYLEESLQYSQAKVCKDFYLLEMKEALKEIRKNKKTACDYLELQSQVKSYQDLIKSRLDSKLPSQDVLDNMHEFYFEMYGLDQATHACDADATTSIFYDQFVLENTKILILGNEV